MKIAVIGAGMAGLACAQALRQAGREVVVFEKSRGRGGRIATRRGVARIFDHGAQYVTAKSESFRAYLEQAGREGFASVWTPEGVQSEKTWWVGQPGMSALVRPLCEGLDLRFGVEIAALERGPEGWRMRTAKGEAPEAFDAVLLAAPAPQAQTLLGDQAEAFPGLAQVRIAPCWAMMAVFDQPLETSADALRPENSPLAWLARDGAKPGREAPMDSWVLHATPEWSRDHLELPPESVVIHLRRALADVLGYVTPEPWAASAHRWRYAQVEQALGEDCLWDGTLGLGLCGDWCVGPRAEAAWTSGRALAERLI
jgi:predicted NAD/FAD-dependent oxidoreductase